MAANKDCANCQGDSCLPEDMPDIGWCGGVSRCLACGGIKLWIHEAPAWDTPYWESLAQFEQSFQKAEAERKEKILKRISDPSRLPD